MWVEYSEKHFFFRVLYKRLFYGNKRLFWTSWFRENVITITDKTTNYIEPNNYQDLNPVTNSSYQDLNPNTNSNYQTLNINTNYRELKLQYGEEEIQYQNTTEWQQKIHSVRVFYVYNWINILSAHKLNPYVTKWTSFFIFRFRMLNSLRYKHA